LDRAARPRRSADD